MELHLVKYLVLCRLTLPYSKLKLKSFPTQTLLMFHQLIHCSQNMATKLNKWGSWFILLVVVYTLNGCFLFYDCIIVNHNYSETFEFSPQTNSISIGDTLWLSSSFSCLTLIDQEKGVQEEFCNASDLSITLQFIELVKDSLGLDHGAKDSFSYVPVSGVLTGKQTSRPDKKLNVSFAKNGDFYEFKLGIIPVKAGNFGIFIGNAVGVRQPGKNSCDDLANFSFTLSNTDTNLELFEEYLGSVDVPDYERTHGYFIEVVE